MRPKHFSIDHGLFFLTVHCARGVKPFLIDKACQRYIMVLREKLDNFKSTLFAYVLMPDHVHLLLQLPENVTLKKLMNHINGASARKLNDILETTGNKLWQGGFYDVYLREPIDFAIKINYIHNNPVKAGIVQHPEDYKFSSARFYCTLFDSALFNTKIFSNHTLEAITSQISEIFMSP